MNASPLVSICIPSYKPRHFEPCLASALAQTYEHCEVIVSDDCPGEEIAEICRRYPRIRYSRNPVPGGQPNIRRLVEMAQGDYIKFLFDDDILNPFCVQRLVGALERTRGQNTTLAFSHRDFIDENSDLVDSPRNFSVDKMTLIPGGQLISLICSSRINLVGEYTTVLFRKRDAYDESGEFRLFHLEGDHYWLDDVTAWFQLVTHGNAVLVPEVLSYYRRHANTNSNPLANPNFVHMITDWQRIADYGQRHGHLDEDALMTVYGELAHTYRRWSGMFPALAERAAELDQKIADMRAG